MEQEFASTLLDIECEIDDICNTINKAMWISSCVLNDLVDPVNTDRKRKEAEFLHNMNSIQNAANVLNDYVWETKKETIALSRK